MYRKNKGSITVEASLVVPLFLFFLLTMVKFYGMILAEAGIHQALAEAAGYTAQYSYLEQAIKKTPAFQAGNTGILLSQFRDYIGDNLFVEANVVGGKNGIILSKEQDTANTKIFYAKADYCLGIEVPFLGTYRMKRRNVIRQKAFLGFDADEEVDYYVFITPNQEVYHLRRDCTHLELQVRKTYGTSGLSACRYCGRARTSSYYIAKDGRVYHCNRGCSGLKRTVSRVRKSEVMGLGPCQRCGR